MSGALVQHTVKVQQGAQVYVEAEGERVSVLHGTAKVTHISVQ